MSGFKLIGIRPLFILDEKFEAMRNYLVSPNWRKNLIPNKFYGFYRDYIPNIIYNDKHDFFEIDSFKKPTKRSGYTSIYTTEKMEINISAIIGMNGSGKSALLELFYAFCYCISKDEPKIQDALANLKKDNPFIIESLKDVENGLKAEIFYEINDRILSIRYLSGEVNFFEYTEKERKINRSFENDRTKDFAYTIALNYSLYGLNDSEAPWLKPLFHKNDGYQTPIVINPMRDKGQIDINSEHRLGQSRILTNLIDVTNDEFELVNGKILDGISLEFSPAAQQGDLFYKKNYKMTDILEAHAEKHEISPYYIFNELIYRIYINNKELLKKSDINTHELCITKEDIEKYTEWDNRNLISILKNYKNSNPLIQKEDLKYWLIKYIVRKVFKICFNYYPYNSYIMKHNNKADNQPYIKPKLLSKLLYNLVNDDSHITDKLKQAICSLEFIEFNNNSIFTLSKQEQIKIEFNEKDYINNFKIGTKLTFDYYRDFMKGKRKQSTFLKEKHFVLGGLFNHKLVVKDKTGRFPVQNMSSGEQHLFQKINTVIYHLRNIDSVSHSLKKFNSVNIVFDEVELYFHPEYQRIFISNLINNISAYSFESINSVNIILSTHSPFILSDIPAQNILRLEEGKVSEKEFGETFGANIHDLLANDFFLKNGFMGQFAKEKINKTIKWINQQIVLKESGKLDVTNINFIENKENHKKTIELIGERVLKIKLIEMLSELEDDKSEFKEMINDEISRLNKLIK